MVLLERGIEGMVIMQRHTDTNGSEQLINRGTIVDAERERLRFWLEMISDMTFTQQILAIESIYISLLRLRVDTRMIGLMVGEKITSTNCHQVRSLPCMMTSPSARKPSIS